MNKNDLKNDFGQPVLNTQKDYEKFMVENSSRPARDETIEESADRYVWIQAGGAKPKSYDDPFIKKIDTMARLPQVNKLVDQKLQGNKTLNYINEKNHQYGDQPKKKLLPTAAKLAEVPILKRNIKYSTPVKTNPTIERYKNFKEEKKFKEEEKKFNKEFEKEYGTETIKREMRAKENKNIKEGRRPYENFSDNDILVAEIAKDEAKEELAAMKTEPKIVESSYIAYRLPLKDTGPKLTLDEHMAKAAPRVMDEPGITALDGVKNFRNIVNTTNQKFPKEARGIGPLISGEDDAK